jgi:hypothetical protein
MFKKSLLFLLLCFALFGVARADVVEIGDGGTTNNQYLPGYNYYNYSLTQQIFTIDEGTTVRTLTFSTGSAKIRHE